MGKPNRRSLVAPIIPAGLASMSVKGLQIFYEPRTVRLGEKEGIANQVNGVGDVLYADEENQGKGYFPEGSQPNGWVPQTMKGMLPFYSQSRGSFSSISIEEKDVDGNDLIPGTPGYSNFEDISQADLLSMVENNAKLGKLHEDFMGAAKAYMLEIYNHINS